MKNLIKNLFLFLISVNFILTSCSKPEDLPRPDNDNPIVDDVDITKVFGVDWKLINGYMIVSGGNTSGVEFYNHFNPSKDTSSLRPEGDTLVGIHRIIKNLTTWRFENNHFFLNGVDKYLYSGNNNLSINGINGSSIIIRIISVTEQNLIIKCYQTSRSFEGVINSTQYETELVFTNNINQCSTCYNQPSTIIGDWVGLTTTSQTVVSQRWLLESRRLVGFNTTESLNDTIIFTNNTQFLTIKNGGSQHVNSYGLSSLNGGINLALDFIVSPSLNNGHYVGYISKFSFDDQNIGQTIDVRFTSPWLPTTSDYIVKMKRLQ